MTFMDSAHALLIGVGKYKNSGLSELPSCPNDLRVLEYLLKDPTRCGYLHQNVTVLGEKDASGKKIRSALGRLARTSGEGSTALIYFSGHGGRIERRNKSRTYLCPWDFDPGDSNETGISGEEFSDLLSSIKARKLLIILDTCHAAGSAVLRAADGGEWKEGIEKEYLETLAQGSGRVVIASSKADQYSANHPSENHGLFTWHLLQGLRGAASVRGDGRVNVLDLFYYVSQQVKNDRPEQEPVLQVKDLDDNFAVALANAAVRPAEPTQPAIVREVSIIREKIVLDPVSGALALSDYLSRDPRWRSKKSEVDLKRAQILDAIREMELLGPNQERRVDKNSAVFYLIKICSELEQEQQ
jgi:hypothetical protein